jgi:hypothetical protein
MTVYTTGYVSIQQFLDAWETNQIKVIVLIVGKGWVPYPDNLLWSGFHDQTGAAEYIQAKYELQRVIHAPNIVYEYQIWRRIEG